MLDVYMERFEHPYLLALVPIAGVLLGLGVVAETAGYNTVSGFLGLYTMVLLIICLIGYIGLFSLKYSTQVLRRWRIRNSGV
ncbi:hypothetical protein [Natronobiforma cellulositropha]|uniref:hypothetical protein n=1 Tax=Natronobiforma cellulositropha TaxID=1679076 RepID=UPI0021D5D869|nr:hypothetical protein [Natronobiforma cellulositropha]